MSQYGKFADFCRDTGNRWSTIPVCNLFLGAHNRRNLGFGNDACDLRGFELSRGRNFANLGSVLLSGIAILLTAFLIWRSNRRKAAVGRREMQLFLLGYLLVSITSLLSIGGFPNSSTFIRRASAVHIGAVVATAWMLMLNGIIGFQILEDGTVLSVGLVLTSALAFFAGALYIALDTGFNYTGFFQSAIRSPNLSYSLYSVYLLLPLLFIVIFFLTELYIVVRMLYERRPLFHLMGAALLFAIGQIFQFVVSVHICNGTKGRINGGMFETLFTLLAVIMVWVFWADITEEEWTSTEANA